MEQSNEQKIMQVIFLRPTTRFSYRELSRQSKVSVGTISKLMPKLEKEGLIEIEVMPNAKYATGNIEKEIFRIQKRLFNIAFLYETGLVDYLDKQLRPHTMILFGSFGKGEDIERSDIDICVIRGRKSDIDLDKFEKTVHKDINLMRLRNTNQSAPEFISALANGIVLKGHFVYEIQ